MNAADAERRSRTALIALVAALVAALAVIGWLLAQERTASDDADAVRAQARALSAEADAEKAALEAAKEVLVQITSYSWKEGEHDFAWLDKIASSELRDKLAPNVEGLQQAIVDGRVTAQGKVVDAMARAVDDSQVEVIAFVDQAITDEKNANVKVEEQRVSMTMKLHEGAWLVDRLELLSGANSGPATG